MFIQNKKQAANGWRQKNKRSLSGEDLRVSTSDSKRSKSAETKKSKIADGEKKERKESEQCIHEFISQW